MSADALRYPCPYCASATLPEPPPGSFHICELCGWEDDRVQFDDPGYAGGANPMSLEQARRSVAEIGLISPEARSWGARGLEPDPRA